MSKELIWTRVSELWDEFEKKVRSELSHQSIKEEQGAEIRCVIEVGMKIISPTIANWGRAGLGRVVRAFSIPENRVLFEDGFTFKLSDLITGIESGNYKIVEQPEERLRWSDRKKEKAAFDWEIVLWWDGKNHEKAHEYEYGDKSCENVGCKIYAVKRLSDGEIFAIGHEVDAPEFSVSGTIISFKKESYGMIALLRPVLDRRGRINTCNLYNLQKKIPAQPQPTKERTEVKKPPLGIKPLWLHREERLEELGKAIGRYGVAMLPIPKEWVAEQEALKASIYKGEPNYWQLLDEELKWPKQKKETDQRTEVTFLSEFAGVLGGKYNYTFWATKPIPPNQFEALKHAIEAHLNHPEAYHDWQFRYTQQQLDEKEEAAFYAARWRRVSPFPHNVYKDFQEYKKSKA